MIHLDKIKEGVAAAYQKEEYPALTAQTEAWRQTRPFRGIRILDASPVFRNTTAKYCALIEAGAELTVGISDVMPCDKQVVRQISSAGIPVVHAGGNKEKTDIILDCAASFMNWPAAIGYVELTRSGVDHYVKSRKRVFIADSGRIKKIETCLGTGESFFRAMKQLGYSSWSGKKLVVFGSGKVGTGIIAWAKKNGAVITVVTEPDRITEKGKEAAGQIIDYRDTPAIEEAVRDAYAVVTATGVLHAVEKSGTADSLIKSQALLINMGVEDEYGPSVPKERVLEEKRPLNFILEEPTHLKYIDATLALHNAGAEFLLNHPDGQGIIEPPAQLEQNLLDICRQNGSIGSELDLI